MQKVKLGLRVLVSVALSVVLVLTMVSSEVFATLEYLDVQGTYEVRNTMPALYLDGTAHPVLPKGTLVITTQSSQTISAATLTMLGKTLTVTGLVGPGDRPRISLYGTDSVGTTVVMNGRITKSGAGAVTGISGGIDGFITSDGYKVVESEGGSPLSAHSVVKANSGAYSALLTAGSGAGSVAVRFNAPPNSLKLSGMVNLTTGKLAFYYYLSAAPGPQLELRFSGPNGVGHVDVTIMPAQGANATTGSWYNQTISSASTRCIYYGNDDVDGTAFDWETEAGNYTLAEIPALIDAETAMGGASAGTWRLTRVGIELWEAGSRTCYVDDVKIGSYTYTLEPTKFGGSFSARLTE